MKVKISGHLKTLDGDVFKDEKGKELDIKTIIKGVLLNAPEEPEKAKDPIAKMERYDLAYKVITAKDEIDITAEEITLLKRLALFMSISMYGAFIDFLEGTKK
jgi:hypothetical protein